MGIPGFLSSERARRRRSWRNQDACDRWERLGSCVFGAIVKMNPWIYRRSGARDDGRGVSEGRR